MVHDGVGGDVSLESLRCVKFGARFDCGLGLHLWSRKGKAVGSSCERTADQPDKCDEVSDCDGLPDGDFDDSRSDDSFRLRLQTIFDWAKSARSVRTSRIALRLQSFGPSDESKVERRSHRKLIHP